jgi:eukaryotic-like serine/threonine-protein kinase
VSTPTPDADRWRLIEEICFEAMQIDPARRPGMLDARCGGDASLRTEVDTILSASDRHPDFLERPVIVVSDAVAPPGRGVLPDGPQPATGSKVDEMIGPYRVIRPIGHGGMGEVYLATREGDGFTHTVAVKVIRRGLDTEHVLHRFRLERRILAGLRHPNIASLLDGGATDDGRPYFVMEYVEGRPIDRYCEARALSLQDRIGLVRTICSAVHHAHQNLVVHRDIKPANILVTELGVPKLLDFGIGKMLAEEASTDAPVTVVDERALTPEYAAPEQLAGGRITTATDVFGLGVLLYRLLTGHLPFPAETGTRAEAIELRRREPARASGGRSTGSAEGIGGAESTGAESTDAERTGAGAEAGHASGPPGRISRELDAILFKALAEKPEDRYSSPIALSEDLRRYLEGRPLIARTPGPIYSARKFMARNRVGVSMGAAALVGLLSMTAYTWQQSRRVADDRDKALEVREFLLEAFGASGAERATGDPLTARALLDGQASTVAEAYANDPALEAEMMIVLAEGYERLGLFSEAETWATRVVGRRSDSEGPELAAALTMLGWVTHQQGRSQEAEPILMDAVAGARSLRGGDRVLARALNDLGVVQEALGRYDDAERSHEEAMALRVALFGADHRSVGVSASNLSAIYYRRGDLDGAVRAAGRALDIMRRSFGPDHQRSIIVLSNLAVFNLVGGDLQGAEDDYRDLWARQARLQGREHPVTVRVMSSLATVLRRAEKWQEAEAVLREAVAIQEAGAAPNPVDLGATLATLGDVLSAGGKTEEAIILIARALALQTEALGAVHVDVAQSQSYMSHAHERSARLSEAIEWQRSAVTTLRRSLGEDHPQTEAEQGRLDDLLSRRPG